MPADYIYNEADLTRRVSQGDEDAMRAIFRIYYPKLCLFANSIVDNKEESSDIAQEALIQMWHQRARFSNQSEENLAAYLFTVARRDCYDYHKHQRVKRARQKEITDQIQIEEEGVEAHLIYLEVLNKIYQEIRNLPPHLSEIVTLSFIEGLTTEEIAGRLHITPNNVRVQKSRALEKLKTAILKGNMIIPSSILLLFQNLLSRL